MAIIALLSAKGSPGVTNTALALATSWPAVTGRSALLVEADPIGGDVTAGMLRGAPVPGTGVLALATRRDSEPARAVNETTIALDFDGRVRLLPGVPDEARAGALTIAWDVLTAAHAGDADQGATDLFVDCGRVSPAGASAPWVRESHIALLVVRPNLPAVAAAHRFAATWPGPAESLRLLLVAEPSVYRAGEVERAVGVQLAGVVAFDGPVAKVYSEGAAPKRNHDRSALVRSVAGLAASLNASLENVLLDEEESNVH